jgi:hypothetical protein
MVTNSASLSLGAIPTSGRAIHRSGLVFSSSSIFTYSAVARVSKSVSTRFSRSALVCDTDFGRFLRSGLGPGNHPGLLESLI